MEINPPFKVFVSGPADYLLTPNQKSVKHKILEMIEADGFEIQFMGERGMPFTREKQWNMRRVDQIMRCCQGAVTIGLPRWYDAVTLPSPDERFNLITEFSHCEDTLAFAHQLPVLRIIEDGVPTRGSLVNTNDLAFIPQNATADSLANDPRFLSSYNLWRDNVKKRYHVFFGYSGAASSTAALIKNFLISCGIRVRDWQEFQTAGTILQQIEKANKTCLGGLFLFTSDDIISSATGNVSIPRDNVIFEAGYFVSSKGDERVQIILEKDTKFLADMGGQIYLPLEDRNNIASIETKLLKFVENRLSNIKDEE
jgi:predicted nucleotide-binding protein